MVKNEPEHRYTENCLVELRTQGYKLIRNLQSIASQHIYIAYSGGIDSHVLLHLCASFDNLKEKITAVYINHGLQSEAESWGRHCEKVCSGLGVKYLSLKANAQAAPGESPEEAARNARYSALKPLLAEDDLLLLAQHAEDQLESVLLQLFRGSGLKGLSGMPETMPFGKGLLLRPLLDISKTEILGYAQNHNLKWIEDPSNKQTHFDRNFLRNDIIPLLKQRWPSLGLTVPRSAAHCANAQSLLASLADKLLVDVFDKNNNTLNISGLKKYPLLQQQLVIRQWFQQLGLRMPSRDFVDRVLVQVVAAREGANPVLSTQVCSIRRYRDELYCLKATQKIPAFDLIWHPEEPLLKLTDEVAYQTVKSSSGIPTVKWHNSKITVKSRVGGETLSLPGRCGHHSLKNLFQEAGIPPWVRGTIPLFYLDGKLAAVGEHWVSSEFYDDGKEDCLRIVCHKINPKGNDEEADVD